MPDLPTPVQPSAASLVKALVIATSLAAALLVLVVLPAERNIDITGFGRAIGLTALSDPALPSEARTTVVPETPGARAENRTVVEVPPGKGLEYKFHVRAGEKFEYDWACDAGQLFYDFHGEPKGAPKNVFESYASGDASGVKGTLTTPFEGTHGWYWKNRGSTAIQVTLSTTGVYDVLGLK